CVVALGTASALSGGTIAGGPDVGATGAFSPVVHGRRLHFLPAAGGFRDRETGSHWSVLGHADAEPLAGQNLTPVTHEDAFWFVWAAFRPHTRVVSRPGSVKTPVLWPDHPSRALPRSAPYRVAARRWRPRAGSGGAARP